ncbi:MAG: hydrolase 76 protein [Lichina confinis]|nr:MAG: hydrolase 76 protein [Lichina confinis]
MRLYPSSPAGLWRCMRACVAGALLLGGQLATAIDLNLDDTGSIKSAAKTCAQGMVSYYTGDRPGDVPGNLPDPYFWWECGAMFGALIDYYYFTGDSQYNEMVMRGMIHQVGENEDYLPRNQSSTSGNDDQAFWGMAAMSAAENKFPNPPPDQPQWLALAQAVFNRQAEEWDETCGGGLRWQISLFGDGFHYKNTISNGCFFNLAARLAKYTNNQTYAEWAERSWDWTKGIGLISPTWQFFDGTDSRLDCSDFNEIQWTYNIGVHLLGVANMYNYTNGDQKWKDRLDQMLDSANVFFTGDDGNVMYEAACEPNGKCNVDQRSFKAYMARWMAWTTKMAPYTYDRIMEKLRSSALAAAKQCNGGESGTACGMKWTQPDFDGSTGLGEQMTALEVIQANLISKVDSPVTDSTGGISEGDPTAGTGSEAIVAPGMVKKISTGDRVGASILTALVLAGVIGGAWWTVV